MIGKTILGYTVDEKIGSGAFGTVYKVSKSNVSGTYTRALKHITIPTKKQYIDVLNSMGGDHSKADNYFAEVLKRVTGEIQIISQLSETGCKNIVRYYENDIVETPPPKTYDIYILMEYLTPFDDFIFNNELKVSDVIKLGKDILTALVSCHSQNIIHRDIKDDNIFVGADNTYKIGDFGVSKLLNDRSRAESMKGTPNYIAPEVYLGKEKYDNTVDLYSLGIVLYRLLNKLRFPFLPDYPHPYDSNDEEQAFEQRIRGKTPHCPANAQNELGEVILKAIKNRTERYNSAEEFLNALNKVESKLTKEELNIVINTVFTRESSKSISIEENVLQRTIVSDIDTSTKETEEFNSSNNLFRTFGSDAVAVNMQEDLYDPNQSVVKLDNQVYFENKDVFDYYSDIHNSPQEPKRETEKVTKEKSKNENTKEGKTKKSLTIVICSVVLAIAILIVSVFVRNYNNDRYYSFDDYAMKEDIFENDEPSTHGYPEEYDYSSGYPTEYEPENNSDDETVSENLIYDNFSGDFSLEDAHLYLNNITYALSKESYDVEYLSGYAVGGQPDFGDDTDVLNSIIGMIDPYASIDSVIVTPFDLEDSLYTWDVFGTWVAWKDKYGLRATTLSENDILKVEQDGNGCVVTIKDCINPERDGNNPINHITNSIVTTNEVVDYYTAKGLTVRFIELKYHDITVQVDNVNDPIELGINYHISMIIEFDMGLVTTRGTCEFVREIRYLMH